MILGSFFFSLGGYLLPYFVLGSSFLMLAFILYATDILNDGSPAIEPSNEVIVQNLSESLLNTNSSTGSEIEKEALGHKFALSFPVSFHFTKFIEY